MSRSILHSFAAFSSFLGLMIAFGPVTQAATTGASFTAIVTTVYANASGPPVAVGDLLRGYLIIDTSRVELITPGAPYANYSVSDGAHIAIYIAGEEFKRSIDYINVTDDRLIQRRTICTWTGSSSHPIPSAFPTTAYSYGLTGSPEVSYRD